ncbi:hypothetical protein B484DRAFT_392077 [Ochromonadaceae sp. CCMP2298]|nr:hypothetical protein B484DRAFT_392077 [Ochromonadaceae sp. CCMP2298]
MGNLREEQEEKQRLEKSNFDLKMKVYYLEEGLKRFQDGEEEHDGQYETMRVERSKMKMEMEEKNIDIEQRNMLLLKSKSAIDALKMEIERLRAEGSHSTDLEERVRRLKQLNDDMEGDLRGQISCLEQQLATTRQDVDAKERQKAASEDRLTHMELNCDTIDAHLRDTRGEKGRLEEQLGKVGERMQLLEEEVTQGRAHVDLYRIQMEESCEERDHLKERLRQEQATCLRGEEDFKSRLHDCTRQYEEQIRTMRSNHEQDMDKMRAGHLAMLADVRDNYNIELEKKGDELDRHMGEVKQADSAELTRVKDNFTLRIDEKNEEIRSLRGMMGADGQRMSALLQELDALRVELKERTAQCEQAMVHLAARSEELKVLPLLKTDLDECRLNFVSLQAAIKQEQLDKLGLSSRSEQASSDLGAMRSALRDCEQQLQGASMDNARLAREVADLSAKADGVELVSRDNERLKSSVARLETETLSLTHKLSEGRRDLERAQEEGKKNTSEREAVGEVLRQAQLRLDTFQDQHDAGQISTQSERERRSAAEAGLAETRLVLQQSREDLSIERAAKLSAEQHAVALEEETREMRKSLGHATVMTYSAMQQWDELLSHVIDGDYFADLPRGISMGPYGASGGGFGATGSGYGAAGGFGSGPRRSRSPMRSPMRERDRMSDPLGEETDLLSISPEQLLQRVAVCIERVGLKLQRAEKIRSLFASQAEKLVLALQSNMHSAHEKVALYQHKLGDTQAQLQQIAHVVQRDRKQREEETRELHMFKEVVLAQHTAQLRDSELRFAQVAQDLDREKQRSEESKRQSGVQGEELRHMQQSHQRLSEDMQKLEHAESIVHSLTGRVGELADTNRALQKEAHSKGALAEDLSKENSAFLQERSALLSRADQLMHQLRTKEDAIEEYDSKLQGLVREIERLRSRQIHPELAKTILDTQSILQTAVGGGGGAGKVSVTEAYDPVRRLQLVEQSVERLINRTAEMIEAGGDEVADLLQANARLVQQLQQVLGEVRKHGQKVSQVQAQLQAPAQIQALAVGHREREREYSFPRRDPGLNLDDLRLDPTSPETGGLEGLREPQYASAIRRSGQADIAYRMAERSPDPRSASASTYKYDGRPGARSDFQTSGGMGGGMGGSMDGSMGGMGMGMGGSRVGIQGQGIQGMRSSGGLGAGYASTPTTSRASSNRLNKLGSDLEALARKLDSYDTSVSRAR